MSANTIVKVDIDASAAIELLAAARGSIGARRDVNDAAANAVAVQVRAWLAARNRARSRHVESQYWAHAAESVSARGLPDAALVVIRHPGVAWHLHGGTIRARPGKALAIPLRDAVYGMRPSELFTSRADAFVYRRRGRAYLAARPDKGVKAGNRTLRILYLLLKSVSKPADPSVLPPRDAMAATASAAVSQLFHTTLKRRNKSS